MLLFVRAKGKCECVLSLDGTFAIPLVSLSTTLDGLLVGCLLACGCSASRSKTKGTLGHSYLADTDTFRMEIARIHPKHSVTHLWGSPHFCLLSLLHAPLVLC